MIIAFKVVLIIVMLFSSIIALGEKENIVLRNIGITFCILAMASFIISEIYL